MKAPFLGSYKIQPLNLDRDYPGIEKLFEQENWPFLRSDLEVSEAQPKSVGFVARNGEEVLGFFTAHHFGEVGYLSMIIVVDHARASLIGQRLYTKTIRQMKKHGLRGTVVHSTNDSYRLFQLLRFQAGETFTLLGRDPTNNADDAPPLQSFLIDDADAIIALDAAVFGVPRESWLRTLLAQPSTKFFGIRENSELLASLCLRPRKQNAFCLDSVNATDFSHTKRLLDVVLDGCHDQRIECFARTGSPLHEYLLANGAEIPEFFHAIGPLVEWRKGETGNIGASPHIQCLSWF